MLYFIFGLLLIPSMLIANYVSVDFDISMGKGTRLHDKCLRATKGDFTNATFPRPTADLYNFFKELYNKNNLSSVQPAESPKIPSIIHMVWIGGKFPAEFHAYRESWISTHPEWTHIFWTDNPINYNFGTFISDITHLKEDLLAGKYAGKTIVIDPRRLSLHNQTYYNQATNMGEKSDILKYELVYKFGGVYIDIDFQAIKRLDLLHRCYDFYVGIQPLNCSLALGAALFGGYPGNPILKRCIETIKDDRHYEGIVFRTGPIHFTKSFWAEAQKTDDIVIAFPATYFYPMRLKYKKDELNDPTIPLIKAETIANHHWAGSWQ